MDGFHWSDIKIGEYAKTRIGIGMITNFWRDYNGWKVELRMEKEEKLCCFSLNRILCLSEEPEALSLFYIVSETDYKM